VNGERGVGRDGQAISPHEWDATYAEAYRRVEARLGRGESIVYDETNFLRRQRERLRAIAAQYSATTFVIYVDVTSDEARRRWLTNRTTRQRGDVRDDDFAYVLANFEPPTADENVLCYDGATPPDIWIGQTFVGFVS
jgi:predicted kinase